MSNFQLISNFEPRGDQPRSIRNLVQGLEKGYPFQTLHGVTGSGKTFTVASVIQEVQRPTLVLAHNKTLAAQLYSEMRELFPNNAVEYFVSYYDYYQPEAYVPSSDTFIAKDAKLNEQIDRMRHSATRSLLQRRDVIIVASVSCIYGIGSVDEYSNLQLHLETGQTLRRKSLLKHLVQLQYARNDVDFHRGTFRVRGDVVEVFPAHSEDQAIRLEFWDDELETISLVDPFRGEVLKEYDRISIFPNSHYVTSEDALKNAIVAIQDELQLRLQDLHERMALIEEQRLRERTMLDIEMIEQMGFCNGIENYSRHLSGRAAGEPPPCLLDYFPEDWLLIVDESHVTLPQVRGMYRGDQARKRNLVDYGFRLPSALDNRPLQFEEFLNLVNQAILVSATPSTFEQEQSSQIVEQFIRPTGLLDPEIEIRPVQGQVDDLLGEIQNRVNKGDRVLVTTLTKRMSEKLTEYYQEQGVSARYLHSDIDTIERVNLLQDLRAGVFDVLIGINLLREGLDLPEVSLVAILDADQQGFLRSSQALLQTAGRAARNAEGRVIMYADRVTPAMRTCIDVTAHQRSLQMAFNEEHGIIPTTVRRELRVFPQQNTGREEETTLEAVAETTAHYNSEAELKAEIERLEEAMLTAAASLDFEEAARLRDQWKLLQRYLGE